MWSSHGLLPYMGYTIHWIDSDWNLKSRNLGTRYVPENHTADNLAESMNDILSYWKLDETKQVAITNTLANESRVKRSLGTCKKIVAAIGTSWKRRRDMTAAQLQEEPAQIVKQLASVSFFITKE